VSERGGLALRYGVGGNGGASRSEDADVTPVRDRSALVTQQNAQATSHILSDADTLVMSPALFERRPIRTPADIEGHVLLSTETRPGDWIDWLERAGVPRLLGQRRQIFDHFHVTLPAIIDGLGLGIGPIEVLGGELRAGRLVAPLPHIQVPRSSYVALVPFDADKSAHLKNLVDWLVAEGQRATSSICQG
jgi:LysR family transcriptional regulator, glycine cleavage system transcriptional activator